MNKMAKGRGGPSVASLNNVLMQMRKNCNHPDLITGPFDGEFHGLHILAAECGWGEGRGMVVGWARTATAQTLSPARLTASLLPLPCECGPGAWRCTCVSVWS
jgi:hypothetical protein